MAGNILWQSGNVVAYFPQLSGTGLQVANAASIMASGNLINNGASGGPCLYGSFELTASASGFGANVNNNVSVDLYLVPGLDGTNYGTASVSGLPFSQYAGSFVTTVSGNVSRLRMEVMGLTLLPVPYQVWINNQTGQTLTSGWSLSFYGHNEAYT